MVRPSTCPCAPVRVIDLLRGRVHAVDSAADISELSGPIRTWLSGPIRTCVGCRQRAAKRELLRVVVRAGALVPDPAAIATGRGAHLHPTPECLALAERRRAFPRALRVSVGLDASPLRDYLDTLA